ncbi:MAG: MFS transporter [Candidatus Binatia bacterium]
MRRPANHRPHAETAERPLAWGMTRYQWTVFAAAWLGWGFDVFDGLLFNFVAPVCVPRLLGIAPGDPAGAARVTAVTGTVTAALLVGWATGGILFGFVTDRLGRSRTLLITMLTYAGATAACALAPDIWTLAALRFVASLGIGGEWAAGASLVAEVVPERRRVAAGALLYTSAPFGIMLAGLMNDLFTKRLHAVAANPDLAWRLVFVSGLFPALVALWVRRRVREPEAWVAAAAAPPIRVLFAPAYRRATLGGLTLSLLTLLTWWPTNAFLPFVVKHLTGPGADAAAVAGNLTYANALFNLGGLLGTIATIPLAHLGRRTMFACYFAGGAAAQWVTFGLDWAPFTRLTLLFFNGLTIFGVVGAFSFYLPELFPVRLRGTGSGFCFNTGRYLAALGPFVVGHALGIVPTPMHAIRWVALVPLVGLAITPFIVETHGRRVAPDPT